MASWIYVFSQFTPEALLFEALAIGALCTGYAVFWVLRKRRYGVLRNGTSEGIVKSYLTQLIYDAEQMRAQLFGLLNSAGVPAEAAAGMSPFSIQLAQSMAGSAGAGIGAVSAQDPAVTQKMALLEAKMVEQAKAMEAVINDKARIEKELETARAMSQGAGATDGSAATGGADAARMAELQAHTKSLEAKLAEYSVIEDDLASLKKLQQENQQLRAALEAAQAGAPAAPQKPAAAEVPAQEAAPIVAASLVDSPETATQPDIAAQPDAATLEETPPAEASAEATADGDAFEGLVDQVEQSLQEATPPPAAEISTSAPAVDKMDSSDADLVAEFEKMLKS